MAGLFKPSFRRKLMRICIENLGGDEDRCRKAIGELEDRLTQYYIGALIQIIAEQKQSEQG